MAGDNNRDANVRRVGYFLSYSLERYVRSNNVNIAGNRLRTP